MNQTHVQTIINSIGNEELLTRVNGWKEEPFIILDGEDILQLANEAEYMEPLFLEEN